MRSILLNNRRRLLSFALGVLAILFMAGCAEEAVEPAEPDRLPSPEVAVLELLPTPTLAPGVPTPPLPTPPITPTVVPDDAQGAADETAESSDLSTPPTATPEISSRLTLGNEALDYGDYMTAIEQFSKALQQEPALEPEVTGGRTL